MTTKTCKECNLVLPIENFYHAGKWYQSKCKPCHNMARNLYKRSPSKVKKPRKPTGFNKLPFDKRVNIIKDIQSGLNYSQVANRNSIKYVTLRVWKKKGLIKLVVDNQIKETP